MALVHKLGWDPHFMARSPWFWPLASATRRFEAFVDWPTLADFDALYAEHALTTGVPPLRFADNVRKQDKRVHGRIVLDALYDGRIALSREVPTRERDWHDFFNVLCFVTFPRAKNALHARQYAALRARIDAETRRLPNARTPEQDALTLFDEGGAVVVAEPDAARALQLAAAEAREAMVVELQQSGQARVVPFGHALFEHLVEGLRCPGGCTYVAAVDSVPDDADLLLDVLDQKLAAALQDPQAFASPRQCSHLHLQALGLPPQTRAELGTSAKLVR